MAGGLAEHITLLLPSIAAPRRSKKHPCFLEAILQHLKTESITCQEGRYEARRTICFEWYFLCDRWPYYQTAKLFRVSLHPQPLRSVSGSSFSFLIPPHSFFRQPPFYPAAASYFGFTRKIFTASSLRFSPGAADYNSFSPQQ